MRRLRVALLSMYNGSVNRGVESWSTQWCHHLSSLGHECVLIQGGEELANNDSFRTISTHYRCQDRSGAYEDSNGLTRSVEMMILRLEMLNFAARCFAPLSQLRPHVIIPVNSTIPIVALTKVFTYLLARDAKVIIRTPSGYNSNLAVTLRMGVDGIAPSTPTAYEQIVANSSVMAKLIPLGVDVSRFESAKTIELDLEPPVVIVTSALITYKRLHLAIQAVARAGMSLLLLGDGYLRDDLCALGEKLLGKRRFRWCPSVAFDEVPQYYKAADVFTLPSASSEAFGVVILEALAAGLPVVVTDDPVRRWMVTDRGYFVDPEDIGQYAATLRRAAAEQKLRHAPDTVRQFDWPNIAQQWSDFLLQVVDAPC